MYYIRYVKNWRQSRAQLVPGGIRYTSLKGDWVEIHPTVKFGVDVQVYPAVTIRRDADIGDYASLGWGVRIGARAHLGVGVQIDDYATVRDDVKVGDYARVSECTLIKHHAVIGAGSSVYEMEVPAYGVVDDCDTIGQGPSEDLIRS